MVSFDYAMEQIQRLAGLDEFPRGEPAAVEELADAGTRAESEEILSRAIDDLAHGCVKCPKPVDVIRAVRAENDRVRDLQYKRPSRSPKCPHCDGARFIHGSFLVTKHAQEDYAWVTSQELKSDAQIKAVRSNLQPNQQILDGSMMCVCHPGKNVKQEEVPV